MVDFTRPLPRSHVAIVGTYTLRAALNLQEFLSQAHTLLGHPVDIISGEQEARLIYDGVLYTCGSSPDNRLIIDIGGGSTELVIGQGDEPRLINSMALGCVRLAKQFADPTADLSLWPAASFQKYYVEACNILAPLREVYQRLNWQECWGTSGTLDAVLHVLMAYKWTDEPSFTARNLEKLRLYLNKHPQVPLAKLAGLTPQRATVFPSGLAILCAFFDVFEIEDIRYASGGLREGLLYQLAQHHGLDSHEPDVRFA